MTAASARFDRVTVIGVGLIGGSFALGLKAAGACNSVVGVGRNPENMRVALELGIVDSVETDAGLIIIFTKINTDAGFFQRHFRGITQIKITEAFHRFISW